MRVWGSLVPTRYLGSRWRFGLAAAEGEELTIERVTLHEAEETDDTRGPVHSGGSRSRGTRVAARP